MPLSGMSTAPGWIAGLVSLQSAGRRTPSPSASPSISSHETRVSASSVIAVSWPSPQSTLLGVAVAGDDVVVAGAAVEDVEAAAAEQAVVAGAAVERTGSVTLAADRRDVVAVAEVEHDPGVTPLFEQSIVSVSGRTRSAQPVAGAERDAAEAGEADRSSGVANAGDLVDVAGVRRGRRSSIADDWKVPGARRRGAQQQRAGEQRRSARPQHALPRWRAGRAADRVQLGQLAALDRVGEGARRRTRRR